MRFFRAAFAVTFLASFYALPAAATSGEDAVRLFRGEVVDAAARLDWNGPALSDETRFAVAATGLSWMPVVDGTPLIVREKRSARYEDAESRFRAFSRLRSSSSKKEAFAYALSLLLSPPDSEAGWVAANTFLSPYGDDVDRALVGVLQAPEKLPLLTDHQYAAMDSLVRRASPRLLPLFLSLSESSDRYLRSRAVAALGMISYNAGPDRSVVYGLKAEVRENSISAVQRKLIAEAIRQAANDKNWRVRASAALALGLIADPDDVATLEKLSKDRAYVVAGERPNRTVAFPVRAQAAASLTRFKREAVLPIRAEGREADKAMRGGQNVTRDTSDVRQDQASRVRFNEIDW
jgi:HEAT repeat protein